MLWAKETQRLHIKSWCAELEHEAMCQAEKLALHPATFHHIALMPDAHVGYGMPIGGVAAFDNAVCPNAVGVDIGCGMIATKTNVRAIEISKDTLKKIIHSISRSIPVGHRHQKRAQEWQGWDKAPEIPVVQQQLPSARKQLGTLGGGNHFIEIQMDTQGFVWLMAHSGSRNFGYKIARHFNDLAVDLCEKWFSALPSKDLAFLPIGKEFQQYIKAMQYALDFAQANRDVMMERVKEQFSYYTTAGTEYEEAINIHHNFANIEHHFGKNVWVHRKGATKAYADQLGIIPGSMGTRSYIIKGKGNPDSFHSCSHGAGRKMGRAEYNRTHTEEAADKEMAGVVWAGWSKDRKGRTDLSEAPTAYKDIQSVIAAQADLVDIVTELIPLAVVKG